MMGLALSTSLVVLIVGSPRPAYAGSSTVIGWVVECDFVRFRADDPIVFPGEPGASHLHAFYGNRRVHANSTYRSLRAAGTSCGLKADRGAYWAPAAYVNDQLIEPLDADFYYRVLTDPSAVHAFPRNLRIVAGDAHANAPQSKKIVDWDCEHGGSSTDRDTPPDCGTGIVSSRVKFPDCWDGRRLDSSDHKRHMAYSVEGPGPWNVCPDSHPIPVPKLLFKQEWPIHDGTRMTLSSGSAVTMHGDFINSWVQRRLVRMVRRCINASRNCGAFGTPS